MRAVSPVGRLFNLGNAPLALLPTQARELARVLRAEGDVAATLGLYREDDRGLTPYIVTGGVACIQIEGLLLNGSGWGWGGLSYYGNIRAGLATALEDAGVRAIALLVNSPGGVIAGCFDLADAIYAMRGVKPIWAILNDNAFSAAYALASAADQVTVPRTGFTGSIGVVHMHMDVTAMLERGGIKLTTIQFGSRKTDQYPTVPLTDAARARMQADVDLIGEMFVDTVARNRGVSAANIRATEAGTFLGGLGVEAGLADAVMSPDEAFLALLATL